MLKGTLLALTSAITWALANVAIQGATRRIGSWAALVWAQLIGLALSAVAALIIDGVPHTTGGYGAVALAAVAGLAAYAGLFESLRRGQVAVVTPIISAWSVVSVLVAIFYLGEPITWSRAVGIGAVVIGNVLVTRGGAASDGAGTPRSAFAWALLAMLGFGLMVPGVEAAGQHFGRLWAVPTVWLAELALAIPLLWGLGLLRRPHDRRDWGEVSKAAICEAAGFISISLALGAAPVAVVSPISSLSTAGSVLLGVFVLRERLPRQVLLGAMLACAGLVLVNVTY